MDMPSRGNQYQSVNTLRKEAIMKNTSNNKSNRWGFNLDKIEDVFMTVSGIAIALSPFLVFV